MPAEMAYRDLLVALGDEVTEVEEEVFILFSRFTPSDNLGFIDPNAHELRLAVGGHDLTIHQSPGLLSSNRAGGTTGAVVWKVTPLFAEWIVSPQNLLFRKGVLTSSSRVLELGCGVSGIVGLLLSPRIGRYFATDQEYVVKTLARNLSENEVGPLRHRKNLPARMFAGEAVRTAVLDWELHAVSSQLFGDAGPATPLDLVLACDCMYNESLVMPLVSTCVDACRFGHEQHTHRPTVCLIAQQLRTVDVFRAWLEEFHRLFRVWRISDVELTEGLQEGSGFVIHLGILREHLSAKSP